MIVSLLLSTADGGDYTSVMQEITAVPGTNLYGVLVTALDDTQHVFDNDGLESFTVTATSAEPGTVPSTTTVVIIDRSEYTVWESQAIHFMSV